MQSYQEMSREELLREKESLEQQQKRLETGQVQR